jgi:hypothetical protein
LLEAHFRPTDVDARIERALAPYLASDINVSGNSGRRHGQRSSAIVLPSMAFSPYPRCAAWHST